MGLLDMEVDLVDTPHYAAIHTIRAFKNESRTLVPPDTSSP